VRDVNLNETVFVFDVGGSAVKAGVVSPDTGDFVKHVENLDIATASAYEFAKALPDAIELLAKDIDNFKPAGIGISLAGLCKDGIVVEAPNLKWFNAPLVVMVKDAMKNVGHNLPISLENDGDCFALGEWKYGVAKEYRDILGITLGTGIGGGFIIDGKIFRGGMGFSIEPGHIKVNYEIDTPPCGCGGRYCLEAGTGAAGIVHTYKVKGGSVDENTTVLDIAARAEEGEEIAQALFRRIGRRLGIGLAGLSNLLNPEAVVIGGGVSSARKFIEPSLRSMLESETLVSIRGKSVLLWSELLNKANLLGAAAMVAKL